MISLVLHGIGSVIGKSSIAALHILSYCPALQTPHVQRLRIIVSILRLSFTGCPSFRAEIVESFRACGRGHSRVAAYRVRPKRRAADCRMHADGTSAAVAINGQNEVQRAALTLLGGAGEIVGWWW